MDPNSHQRSTYASPPVARYGGGPAVNVPFGVAVTPQMSTHLIPPSMTPQTAPSQVNLLSNRGSSPLPPRPQILSRPPSYPPPHAISNLNTPQRALVSPQPQSQTYKIQNATTPQPVQQRPLVVPQSAPPLGGSLQVVRGNKKRSAQIQAPPPVKTTDIVPAPKRKKKLGADSLGSVLTTAIPESVIYNQLLEMEKKLDCTLLRKKHDIQEALRNPEKVARTLRLHITSSCSKKTEEASGMQEGTPWTLNIVGRILEGTPGENKTGSDPSPDAKAPPFSAFLKRITVELDPSEYSNSLLTWDGESKSSSLLNGFEIKRVGKKDFTARITIDVKYLPQRFEMSPKLSSLLGLQLESRPRIIAAVWQYIKAKKLQSSQDPAVIDCDAALRDLFGESRVKMSSISGKLHAHLSFPKPVQLQHTVHLSRPGTRSTDCYDISVDVPIPLKKELNDYLTSLQKHSSVEQLNEAILEDVGKLQEHRLRRAFFLGFSESPVDFIHRIIASQERDLRQIMGESGGDSIQERRSDFYRQPWVEDAVLRYLNRRPTTD